MAADLQKQVQDAIDRQVDSGVERGVQVAAYRRGEQAVDTVAGVADPSTGRKVASDTPFYNFSICKAAASTLVRMLAGRGLFTYETPVAELWPEFGAHGKQAVTVRQVLNHSAGVPGIPPETTVEDLRLGQDVRRDRLRRTLVGAGHEAWLPRIHLRLPRR